MANKMPKQSRGVLAFIGRGFLRLRDVVRRVFAHREVFVRQGSETKHMVLNSKTQAQLLLVGAGLLAWFAYSTSGAMMGKTSTHAMQDRLAETHNAYENRLADMQEEYEALNLKLILAKKEFSRMTEELKIRHDHLAALIGMQDRLGTALKKRRKTNRAFERQELKKSKKGKQSFLTPLRNSDSTFLTSRPVGATHTVFPAVKASDRKISASKIKDKKLSTASSATFHAQHTSGLLNTGSPEIDSIGAQLAVIDQRQRAILDHLHEKITTQTEIYERTFHITEAIEPDLFAERIFTAQPLATEDEKKPGGTGGPLLPIAEPKQVIKNKNDVLHASADSFIPISRDVLQKGETHSFLRARKQINRVHQHIKKLTTLDQLIRHLPLAKPMPAYYVTSAFGPRIDPFTREWAFHSGVDIAGPKKSKVHATLPGKVTFVGHARGYGKMVEVDHGHGIKTRYGHLGRSNVKFGQNVTFKQHIGLMGNTGRSTGDHLHYEILVDDKTYDPWKFIEAGKYVFEIVE